MVAKSFQNTAIVGEPYTVNGRQYVRLSTGRQVRWYTPAEYARLYGEEPKPAQVTKTQKEVLGFKNGYITIFKGDTYSQKDWFKTNGATYTRFWGWSFSSEKEVPAEIPEGLEAVRLEWDLVGNEDEKLKNEDLVKAAVGSIVYEESDSEYYGEIGDRIEVELTVEKDIAMDNFGYGPSIMHIMKDSDGNTFVWTTASKHWEVGSTRKVRGTIKDHRMYRNVKQTVLTRCTEVKK